MIIFLTLKCTQNVAHLHPLLVNDRPSILMVTENKFVPVVDFNQWILFTFLTLVRFVCQLAVQLLRPFFFSWPAVTQYIHEIWLSGDATLLPVVAAVGSVVAVLLELCGVEFWLLLELCGVGFWLVLLVIRPRPRLFRSDWDCMLIQVWITVAFSNNLRSWSWLPRRPFTSATVKPCAFQMKHWRLYTVE